MTDRSPVIRREAHVDSAKHRRQGLRSGNRPCDPRTLESDLEGGVRPVSMTFAERVRAREVVVGTFLNLASPLTAEIVGLAGMDWVVIDLEHGPGTEREALAQMQALAHTGTVP